MGLRVGSNARNLDGQQSNPTLAGMAQSTPPPSDASTAIRTPAAEDNLSLSGKDRQDLAYAKKNFPSSPGQGAATTDKESQAAASLKFLEGLSAPGSKNSDAESEGPGGLQPESDLKNPPNTGPITGFIRNVGRDIKEHPAQTIGAVGGQVLGEIGGGPPAGIAASALGGMVGKNIDNMIQGKEMLSPVQNLVTGVQQAGLALMGNVVGKGLSAGGTNEAFTTALSEEGGQLLGATREQGQAILNYAKQIGTQAFKHQVADGTIAGATAREQTVKAAQGVGGFNADEVQMQLQEIQLKQDRAIQTNLQNQAKLLPEPKEPTGDPAKFLENWKDGKNEQMQKSLNQVPEDVRNSYKFENSGLLDAATAYLKKKNIINPDGSFNRLASDSSSRDFLRNWVTDMRALTKKPAVNGTGAIDEIWNKVANMSANGVEVSSFAPPIVQVVSKDAIQGGGANYMSFGHLDALRRNLLDEISTNQGDELLNYMSKEVHEVHYNTLADVFKNHLGDAEGAFSVRKTGQELSSFYHDVGPEMIQQIQKNPSSAVRTMINRDNPTVTENVMKRMTEDQRASLGRAFWGDSIKQGTDQNGRITAKSVLDHISGYGDKNLDLVLGANKEGLLSSLKYASKLQSTAVEPGAQKSLLDKLTRQVSGLDNPRGYMEVIKDLIGSRDVKDLMATDEYMEKFGRYIKANSYSRNTKAALKAIPQAATPFIEGIGSEKQKPEPEVQIKQ